jgi:predicted nucleic acid-binding protein
VRPVVVDTSAVLAALTGGSPADPVKERLSAAGSLHAPHLLDIEVLHALRGLVHCAKLSTARAQDARTDFASLRLIRYPADGLADRIWELRENLTAYDGCFVALAESLAYPLVTCDARLGRASGHQAEIAVVAAGAY